MLEEKILEIEKENQHRLERIEADYNPITGEGLADYLNEERVLLDIPDFPIKRYVPKEVVCNPLIKQIIKAGGIQKFIDSYPWQETEPTFLEVERAVRKINHKHDFCFWAFFCIQITAKTGGRVRFKLNYPQLKTLAELEKLRKQNVPIDIIILKARQWGGSTLCIFYQTWITFEWDEYHSFVVAAHVNAAADNILQMLRSAIESYPVWDLDLSDDTEISLVQRAANAYVIKDSSHAQILPAVFYVGSAEKPETLRSSNVHGAHYSEVGVWPDTPQKRPRSLVASISGGMTTQALDMQVMESTAKSSDDFFHTTWVEAKQGISAYHPVFIPWYYIPHDTRKISDKKEFIKWLLTHKDDESTNGKWKDTGKHYWWLWENGATLEGINWYRYKRLSFESYSEMANEIPTNDKEAFQSAGHKAFDFYEVEEFASQTRKPLVCGELYSLGEIGEDAIKEITFKKRKDGNLMIWEYPDYSPIENRYVVAVDIGGENSTSDFSSVRVIDRLMMMEDFGGLDGVPSIVAEMHYHTPHDLLAYDSMRLARWYNNALLVIESNTVETENPERDTGGDGSEYILDIVGNIYPNLYMRRKKSEDIKNGVVRKWGFHTNRKTKPKIINHMKTCLREKMWIEPSILCTDEMSTYIEDRNTFNAAPSKHDDVVMSTAILLWICYRELPLPSWKVSGKPKRTSHVRGNPAAL